MVEEAGAKSKKSKIVLAVLIVVVLALILTTFLLLLKSRQLEEQLNLELAGDATLTSEIGNTSTIPQTPTSTAKFSKTAEKTTEPTLAVSDENLITQALAKKFSKDVSDITVTVSKKDSNNAFGGLSFKDELGGGYFVAVRQGSEWIIIADGNGTIDCAVLDQYSVPASIVGECFNSDTQESVTR